MRAPMLDRARASSLVAPRLPRARRAALATTVALLALVLFALFAPSARAADRVDPGDAVDALADKVGSAFAQRYYHPDVSPEGERAWLGKVDGFADELGKIPESRLTQQQAITRALVSRFLNEQHDYVAKGYDQTDLRAGDYDSLLTSYTRRVGGGATTPEAWKKQIDKLEGSAKFVEHYIALLQRGLDAGRGRPPEVVKNAIEWLDAVSSNGPGNPFLRLESELETSMAGKKELPELKQRLAAVVHDELIPSHTRLLTFLKTSYLPNTTGRLGDDRAEYLFQMQHHIGPGHTPEQLSSFGKQEVARLTAELEQTARQIDPNMKSLASFMRTLRSSAGERYKGAQDMIETAREETAIATDLAHEMAPVPRHETKIAPVSKEEENTIAGAFDPGSKTFLVNTGPLLKGERKFNMATLATHETFGGHALASLYQDKLDGKLPSLRNGWISSTSFEEGWALYSEQWRDEQKKFTPRERVGYLVGQLWRAARLVVDTGIHTGTMTPAEATEYFHRATFEPKPAAAAEIRRYVNWPGQALAYQVGKQDILQTRAAVKASLGEHYDERRFHQKLLSLGSVDPSISRPQMMQWAKNREAQMVRRAPTTPATVTTLASYRAGNGGAKTAARPFAAAAYRAAR